MAIFTEVFLDPKKNNIEELTKRLHEMSKSSYYLFRLLAATNDSTRPEDLIHIYQNEEDIFTRHYALSNRSIPAEFLVNLVRKGGDYKRSQIAKANPNFPADEFIKLYKEGKMDEVNIEYNINLPAEFLITRFEKSNTNQEHIISNPNFPTEYKIDYLRKSFVEGDFTDKNFNVLTSVLQKHSLPEEFCLEMLESSFGKGLHNYIAKNPDTTAKVLCEIYEKFAPLSKIVAEDLLTHPNTPVSLVHQLIEKYDFDASSLLLSDNTPKEEIDKLITASDPYAMSFAWKIASRKNTDLDTLEKLWEKRELWAEDRFDVATILTESDNISREFAERVFNEQYSPTVKYKNLPASVCDFENPCALSANMPITVFLKMCAEPDMYDQSNLSDNLSIPILLLEYLAIHGKTAENRTAASETARLRRMFKL